MSDGLRFSEHYGNPLGDVLWMLFGTADAAGFAAGKPLAAPPGTAWSYSSGTTNIIARALRHAVGGDDADYLLFPRRALFEPLGMTSAVMEPDAAGDFVGSSFMFATARDWARFGQLYLQDGVWDGRRILPEGWVAFSVTPAPAAPGGVYGAHFWLRLGRGTYAPSGDDGLPAGRLPRHRPRGADHDDRPVAPAGGGAPGAQRRPRRVGPRRVPAPSTRSRMTPPCPSPRPTPT